jgi:predicted nucleic acid-binding Zn finger protein
MGGAIAIFNQKGRLDVSHIIGSSTAAISSKYENIFQ